MLNHRYDETTATLHISVTSPLVDENAAGRLYSIGPECTHQEVCELIANFAFALRDAFVERFDGDWLACLDYIGGRELCGDLEEAQDFDEVDWYEVAESTLTEAMVSSGARRLSVLVPRVAFAQVIPV